MSAVAVGWTVAAVTDVGRRADNQDAVLALAPGQAALGTGWSAAIAVADGAGGHAAGAEASRLAIAAVTAGLRAPPLAEAEGLQRRMARWLVDAHAKVRELGQQVGESSGSTLTVLAITRGQLILGHIGDSRAYRWREGQLTQLSADHTAVAEAVQQGQLTAEQAATSPFRHQLTRALGLSTTAEPQTRVEPVREGDVYLVCTDGLWEHLDERELAAALASPTTLHETLDGLVRSALARGASDNISLAALRCGVATPVAAPRRPLAMLAVALVLFGSGLGVLTGAAMLRRAPASDLAPVTVETGPPPPPLPPPIVAAPPPPPPVATVERETSKAEPTERKSQPRAATKTTPEPKPRNKKTAMAEPAAKAKESMPSPKPPEKKRAPLDSDAKPIRPEIDQSAKPSGTAIPEPDLKLPSSPPTPATTSP